MNLLFIYTDEQAYNTLAAYGNDQIVMPNLNRFAAEAVVFDQAYVTQPVCTPSRSSLLTGLWPHTSGMTENNLTMGPDIKCLPEMTSDEYRTAHYGKWHLGDELFAQHGFKDWIGVEDSYNEYFTEGRDMDKRSDYTKFLLSKGLVPTNGEYFSRNESAALPEEYSKPKFLADEASRFLRENRDNPFILYVNFLEPHMPYHSCRDDQYDPADMPLPPNFNNRPTEDQSLRSRIYQHAYETNGFAREPLKTENDWRDLISRYWGMCSLVDTHVGSILDTLDRCGLRDNTVVVFTSDHGDMMGSHRLLAKGVMFEESVRVPLMIRLPGQGAGKRVTGPISQIDVVPTLLDLMNQPVPDHLQGRSLRPCIENQDQHDENTGGPRPPGAVRRRSEIDVRPDLAEDVIIEWNGSNTGFGDSIGRVNVPECALGLAPRNELEQAITDPVRTIITADGWKFSESGMGLNELYNLNDDPCETSNLANMEEHAGLIENLSERIGTWKIASRDS